jgi:hypothetical protein
MMVVTVMVPMTMSNSDHHLRACRNGEGRSEQQKQQA